MKQWKNNNGLILETQEDVVLFLAENTMHISSDLLANASKNWLPSQVEMLIRLLTSTFGETEYAEVSQEDINDFTNLLMEVKRNE